MNNVLYIIVYIVPIYLFMKLLRSKIR